ncbi:MULTISPECIES: hybrid sensor histidine kinase/response regulator [unclassified Roseofilum]|uniref:hybrid sensor histidine kinase/response regulator n=1 Tax=unclassified Roseofilum TaxID=2620099 RepID=UPI000E803903|nr:MULTISPECIES: hybrid sensor histidine kinase/response regulator [unclassified Roseofilum]MBP0008455.1 hybrid sensor histidine kinase/response regulator [Roseofilum sp. Belize Diploria]MBP0033240.1 hybrid sensor histidine kinase/response regulator [Roseofilum sp. Belize BBD 4]HBQ98391.1 hybrid sensor histidine kinase/response regulator [Cyanobacteria bacterium UBA11691]
MNSKVLADLLIVDDTPNNLRLLSSMLTEKGYKVRKAIDAKGALKAIEVLKPDLILLDIRMPEMDGYQVCQILKADARTQDIPVIFISALDETVDKVRAFNVGGVDYITKPFQAPEVLARVATHLQIHQLQQQLETQNTQLQAEIVERQKAEAGLKVLLHAVSHDLRNPVTGMLMVFKNLLKRDSFALTRSMVERMADSCDRQLNLINSLIETQHSEIWGVSLNCESLSLSTLTAQLAADWEPVLSQNQATLEDRIASTLPLINGDRQQLWRVFENLFANALKHNPPGLSLTLSARVEGDWVRCTVGDNGIGMSKKQCETLFQPYTRGDRETRKTGLGLGLYLCSQIIHAHGGEIGVDSVVSEGTNFWFTLPTL